MRNAKARSTSKRRVRERSTGISYPARVSGVKKGLIERSSLDYDEETVSWVSRCASSGGSLTTLQQKAVDAFVRTIKNTDGLRSKLKRVNLFVGDFTSSLVPVFADAGNSVDQNNLFATSDYSSTGSESGLKGSGSKYLDTGLTFANSNISYTNGHLAVNTVGNSVTSSFSEWLGRDWASFGSSLPEHEGEYHFRWGDHLLTTSKSNPQSSPHTGFYLGSVSSTSATVRLNNYLVNSKTIQSNSPSGATDKTFRIFTTNTDFTQPTTFNQGINFYSIGLALTEADSKVLYDAVLELNKTLSREYFSADNLEVWEWANHRVSEQVGDIKSYFSQDKVDDADAWMKTITDAGIRGKIDRANLFLADSGSSYGFLSSLVPLIIDKGNRIDTNIGFIQSDYSLASGLKGNGLTKHLDTGVKSADIFSDTEGHLSVKTASETLSTAHLDVIGTKISQTQGLKSEAFISLSKEGYRMGVGKESVSQRTFGEPIATVTGKTYPSFGGETSVSWRGGWPSNKLANISKASGKWYFEYMGTGGYWANGHAIGIGEFGWGTTHRSRDPATKTNTASFPDHAHIDGRGSAFVAGDSFRTGNNYPKAFPYGDRINPRDIIGVACDLDNNKITFYKNGSKLIEVDISADKVWYPLIKNSSYTHLTAHVNFGNKRGIFTTQNQNSGTTPSSAQSEFWFDPPVGYKAWADEIVSYSSSTQTDVTSKGYFAFNRISDNSAKVYINGQVEETDTASVTYIADEVGTDTIKIYKAFDQASSGNSDQFINFYSIGNALQDSDLSIIDKALGSLDSERKVLKASDPDVYKWANSAVPRNGGSLTQLEVDAVNAWMIKVKSVSGLHDKIKRANLMVGSSLNEKLVPIISTLGESVDIPQELYDSDVNVKGIRGGPDKYINTKVKLSDFLTNSSGHFSVQQSKNFNASSNGNAHGVFPVNYDKPKFGIQFYSDSVEAYIYDNDSSASHMSQSSLVELYVSSLDKNDGDTTFSDIAKGHGVTRVGNVSHKNTVGNPFDAGGTAMFFDPSFGASRQINVWTDGDPGDYDFGTADYRIECWVYVPSSSSGQGLYNTIFATDLYKNQFFENNGVLKYYTGSSGGSNSANTVAFPTNQWNHVLVARHNGTVRIYLNGKFGFANSQSGDAGGGLTIGGGITGYPSYSMGGYIYDFRVTSGSAANYSNTINTSDWAAFDEITTNLGYSPKTVMSISNPAEEVSLTPIYVGSFIGSGRYYKYHNSNEVKSYFQAFSSGNGQMTFNFNAYVEDDRSRAGHEAIYYVSINGIIDSTHVIKPGYARINNGYGYTGGNTSFTVDVSDGDLVSVSIKANNTGGRFEIRNLAVTGKYSIPSEKLNGLWTASRTSSSSLALYQGAVSKVASTNIPFETIRNRDDFVYVLAAYGENGSTTKDFSGINSHAGFYSLGEGLTSEQVTGLSDAYNIFESNLKRSLDNEVYDWAYNRIPANGGSIDEKTVTAVNTFMEAIKAEAGLREQIKRLNIFAGTKLSSALVPLIQDAGFTSDLNYNFTDSDLSYGLIGNRVKFLDTGVSTSITENSQTVNILSSDNYHLSSQIFDESIGVQGGTLIGETDNLSLKSDCIGMYSTPVSNCTINLNIQGTTVSSENADRNGWILGNRVTGGTTSALYRNNILKGSAANSTSSTSNVGSILVFGQRSSDGIPSASYRGRMSMYSLGKGLSDSQRTALKNAIDALNISLSRGQYISSDPDVWDWANVRVPANSGKINQTQVDAITSWMEKVKSVPNLKQSIERCNLFVGNDINAALVPIIKNSGNTVDFNNNFAFSDYTSTGLTAGLKTNGVGKTLDTGVTASSCLADNYHMAFGSPSNLKSNNGYSALMGSEAYFKRRVFLAYDNRVVFSIGSEVASHNSNRKYSSSYGSLNGASYVSAVKTISYGNDKETQCPVYSYKDDTATLSVPTNSLVYVDSAPMSSHIQAAPSTIVNGKGFYSVENSSSHSNSNNMKLRIQENGIRIEEVEYLKGTAAPSDTIAIFGTKALGQYYAYPQEFTMDFYCFGKANKSVSSTREDVFDGCFNAEKMNLFLQELRRDLGRSKTNSTSTVITSSLDSEVEEWANKTVPSFGGKVSEAHVQAVNNWMNKIKQTSGLREKIYRCNLFIGDNLKAGLVPVIADKGNLRIDLNKGSEIFKESDFANGLNAGLTANGVGTFYSDSTQHISAKKFIDTTFTPLNGNISVNNGHVAFSSTNHGNSFAGNSSFAIPLAIMPETSNCCGNIAKSMIRFEHHNDLIDSNKDAFYGFWSKADSPSYVFDTATGTSTSQAYSQANDIIMLTSNSNRLRSLYVDGTKVSEVTDYNDKELEDRARLFLFGYGWGKPEGGLGGKFPKKHTVFTVKGSTDSEPYIFALTDKSYSSMRNLTLNTINSIIREDHGNAWSVVDRNDIYNLSEDLTNNILSDLGFSTADSASVDSPVGWISVGGKSGRDLNVSYDYLYHYLNKDIPSSHNYENFESFNSNDTIIRKVYEKETLDYNAGAQNLAPVFIKLKLSDLETETSYSKTFQSWDMNISYYSVGAHLSQSEVSVLNSAYDSFAKEIGRKS